MSKKHFQTVKWHEELSQGYHNGTEMCGLKLALKLFPPTHSIWFLADQVLQDNNSGFKTSRRPPGLSWLLDFMSLATLDHPSFTGLAALDCHSRLRFQSQPPTSKHFETPE